MRRNILVRVWKLSFGVFNTMLHLLKWKGIDRPSPNFKILTHLLRFTLLTLWRGQRAWPGLFYKMSRENGKKESTSGILQLYVTCLIKSQAFRTCFIINFTIFFFFFNTLLHGCFSAHLSFSIGWMLVKGFPVCQVVIILKTTMNEQSLFMVIDPP